mmetsp:Transcript_18870/g.27638  ORF Transcript_18870/g.27638 Transcript_18870/m.27638 type:complete len:168 (-) Transcript_18870:268-771(-)
MTNMEAVDVVETSGKVSNAQAKNWWKNAVKRKCLPRLRSYGRLIKAAPITLKRSSITYEQQFQWHSQVSLCTEELKRRNDFNPKFLKYISHFIANIDVTCVLSHKGNIWMVGDGNYKHSNKNTSNARLSLTICRCGVAAGFSGPWCFIGVGKSMICNSWSGKRLRED